MLTRPLSCGAAALIITGLLTDGTALDAAAIGEQSEAAGYYRMSLGDFKLTALSDGALATRADMTLTSVAAAPERGVAPAPLPLSVNAYLIDTGERLLLVDTGSGTLLGPGVGQLLNNLRAAGYRPEQVNEIYLTHMQPDHVGGLLWERKATFPNAIVRASRSEADYWLAKSSMAAAPVEERQRFVQVAAALKPYILAGRFKTFDAAAELAPGIRALPDAAHTLAAHTIYVVDSRGKKIFFGGDALHVTAAPLRNSSAAIRLDADADSVTDAGALANSTALLADAAAHGYWVAGAHLSFPGIGRVHAAGDGFQFLPVSYSVP